MLTYAEESEQVKRARRKLKQKLSEIDKLVTPEALSQMTEEIHLWISKNIKDRIDLKNKNISLFDENQNYAHTSNRSIRKLRDVLQEQIIYSKKETGALIDQLKGRIKQH